MHDIYNPWHGCRKCSEGCLNCYMFYLDKVRSNKDGSKIYKTKSKFRYPLAKNRNGEYKIKSGEQIRVCMTSDFFLEEADLWRNEVWQMIKKRADVIFFILTKRAHRIAQCLPDDWHDGYENVFLHVTCENQKRAEERLNYLLQIKAKHKGIMAAPLLEEIHLEKYLKTKQIEQVICGGENYDGSRECNYAWVKSLSQQCQKENVKFTFIETGTNFVKDNKRYIIKSKDIQAHQAFLANLNFEGKPINFKLYDEFNNLLEKKDLYKPKFLPKCFTCGSKPICNGCSMCGKCQK